MRYLAILIAGFCFAFPAHAQSVRDTHPNQVAPQAQTDPLKPIYTVAGVYNKGTSNTGIATTFACSSFSAVPETIAYRIRDADGTVVAYTTVPVAARATQIASTHATAMSGELILSGSPGLQGSATILSTTTNMFCSAMLVDASTTTPSGIALHMIRRNPHGKLME